MIIFFSIIVASIGALFLYLQFSPQFGGKPNITALERIQNSEQYTNGKFVNVIETPIMAAKKSTTAMMRDYFKNTPDRTPVESIISEKITNAFFENCGPDDVKISWLGHSSVLLGFEGSFFLTDPMFGKWATPVPFMGPKRFSSRIPLAIKDIPRLDGVIISHDHYDHLDYKTIVALEPKTERFYMPLGVGAHLEHWGIPASKIVEMDWWEQSEISDIQLLATPSRHFSGRGLIDRNKTLWASWIIKSSKHKIYFSGDSGYSPHFQEIGNKYGPFDLTLMECGAYSENWPYVHMMPEQTAQAHEDLQGKVLLPIHWAQFKLSMHSWYEPIERLLKKAKQKSITVASPKIGESFILNETPPNSQWWKTD